MTNPETRWIVGYNALRHIVKVTFSDGAVRALCGRRIDHPQDSPPGRDACPRCTAIEARS